MNETSFEWVTQHDEISKLGQVCEGADWIALDLEANSMFCYQEQVCLLQINVAGKLFVIDTLALGNNPTDLDPLKPYLEDAKQACYVHGGEYDVCCLKRDYNIHIDGLWDSQQAAAYLGYKQTGYGHLAQAFCDVELDKSFSQYNWGTRPLDEAAINYAVNDVKYLPTIIEALKQEVLDKDIQEEVLIANQAVMDSEPKAKGFDPGNVYRIKGFSRLHPSKHPVLFALFKWRDELAKDKDIPSGRIINAEVLIQLAQKTPTNFGSLKRIRLKSWILKEHGTQVMDIIKQAMREPPELPDRKIQQRKIDYQEKQREQRLKDWRRSESERRELPFQVILPARALAHLKEHGADDFTSVPQFGKKRAELYGEKIKEICAS